jgi:hypothetical protein
MDRTRRLLVIWFHVVFSSARSVAPFCLSVRALTRLTVHEAPTFRALQRERRTFPVFHFPGVEFEIPFHKVVRQTAQPLTGGLVITQGVSRPDCGRAFCLIPDQSGCDQQSSDNKHDDSYYTLHKGGHDWIPFPTLE